MNTYRHTYTDGHGYEHAPGKVVCVGRNYAAHALELSNPVPTIPLLFMKPATAVVSMTDAIALPQGRGACHHELEVALLIGLRVSAESAVEAGDAVVGVGLALDLTLRDLQQTLKDKGHPWEIAKAFDGACPLSPFLPVSGIDQFSDMTLEMRVNGAQRQRGTTADMITPIPALLAYISAHFTLLPGDVVLTGTPEGVAELCAGDVLSLNLGGLLDIETVVQGG